MHCAAYAWRTTLALTDEDAHACLSAVPNIVRRPQTLIGGSGKSGSA